MKISLDNAIVKRKKFNCTWEVYREILLRKTVNYQGSNIRLKFQKNDSKKILAFGHFITYL